MWLSLGAAEMVMKTTSSVAHRSKEALHAKENKTYFNSHLLTLKPVTLWESYCLLFDSFFTYIK